jgi:hypothetical protein
MIPESNSHYSSGVTTGSVVIKIMQINPMYQLYHHKFIMYSMYIYIMYVYIYIYILYIIITKYITIFWLNIVKPNWFIGFTTFCKTMHSLGETRTKMHPAKTSVLKFLFLPPGREPHV